MIGIADSETATSLESRSPVRPKELSPESGGTEDSHQHRPGRADQRLWLEAVPDQASTTRLHPYCLDCGAVRSMLPLRGRPLGYFEQALANLKADLEGNPRYPKLAQVHSRLIAKALESIPDFGDPYSMPFETQWDAFVNAVQRCRPDLDIDLIRSALPREPRRPRPAYISLIHGGAESEIVRANVAL
ncbi:MAG: hypothetical protein AABX97_01620 [Candidatus Thermoplasmatota archaeon]